MLLALLGSEMRSTQLSILLGLSLVACQGVDSDLDYDPSTGDGYRFTRNLAPDEIELGGELSATYNPRDYVAVEFEVPEAQIVYVRAAPSMFTEVWDWIWDLEADYQNDVILFHVDEDADPNDPDARYDYITQTDGFLLTATFRPLEYRVERPGRFMALFPASQGAEVDELDVTVEVEGTAKLNERAPGNLSLEVLVFSEPAVGLRVAAGTAEGYVGADGMVELRDVEPGLQTIRFGERGLGRVFDCEEVFVTGDGETERLRCRVLIDDYDAWMNE
jgi:hypothetical protein